MSATAPVGAEEHRIGLTINGQPRSLLVLPWTTLLDLLREQLEMIGTKKGCDHGQCGACTVLRDGKRINACLTLAVMCEGAHLVTIEGLASGGELHPLQRASSATMPSSAATAPRARSAPQWGWRTKAMPTPHRPFANR